MLPGSRAGNSGSLSIAAAERAGVFEAYGWVDGKLGDLESLSTVVSRAWSAIRITPDIMEAGRYSPLLITRITNWLAIYDANVAVAGGGSRQTILKARDTAGGALAKANSRVRHYYCSLSDEVDQTLLLKQIGMQPRRDKGAAKPDPPGDTDKLVYRLFCTQPGIGPHRKLGEARFRRRFTA